jgi:hypothetical protein
MQNDYQNSTKENQKIITSRSSSKMMTNNKNPLMFHVVHNNKKIMSENK